jgi:hypothetical protein
MVPVRVRAPGGIDAASLDGKVDTAADLCAAKRYAASLQPS